MATTPSDLGYRMPAEWEKHDATWLSWPKDPDTFPPGILGAVEKTYAEIIEALSEGEEVRLLVDDERAERRARAKLKGSRNLTFVTLKTTDVWVRDYAPIYVKGRDIALTKWTFNAWGGKYDDLKPDNEAGEALACASGLRTFEPKMVLEGGSVDVNGKGTLLTTEQCMLNPNRNPGLGREAIERKLRENFGVPHIVWLGSGIQGDDTDGHIDDVARFVSSDTVVLAWESNTSDPNHAVLEDDLRRLRNAEDQDGEILDIVTIPMPKPLDSPGGRLPASHLNFYTGNAAVLVPTFDSPSDADAVGTLRAYFPGRDVIGIDCRALVYGLGAIHCVTQQVPSMRP
jgi:agmatine deiminase